MEAVAGHHFISSKVTKRRLFDFLLRFERELKVGRGEGVSFAKPRCAAKVC